MSRLAARRWGWVSVALGLPGLGILGYGCAMWWRDTPEVMSTGGGETPRNPGEIVCDALP